MQNDARRRVMNRRSARAVLPPGPQVVTFGDLLAARLRRGALVTAEARDAQEPCVPLYRAAPAAVQSGAVNPASSSVACRCCPGGASRSRRRPRYPSDMSGTEWAVCEPLLPHPGWLMGKGGARPATACAASSTAPATSPITDRCGGRSPRISGRPGRCITGHRNGRPTITVTNVLTCGNTA